MAPVCAVVGGILAQEIVKVKSLWSPPLTPAPWLHTNRAKGCLRPADLLPLALMHTLAFYSTHPRASRLVASDAFYCCHFVCSISCVVRSRSQSKRKTEETPNTWALNLHPLQWCLCTPCLFQMLWVSVAKFSVCGAYTLPAPTWGSTVTCDFLLWAVNTLQRSSRSGN